MTAPLQGFRQTRSDSEPQRSLTVVPEGATETPFRGRSAARVALGVAGIVLAAVAACLTTIPRRFLDRALGG